MSTIFISHSSSDNDLAVKVKRRLAQAGHHSMFLDLDPEKGIVAGKSWEQTLYRKVRACRTVVALCTDNYLSSHWCFAEIALARMEGKHLIALQSVPWTGQLNMPSILSERQFIDIRQNEEEGFQRMWRSLKELDLVGHGDWNPKDPPYLGMSAYQEEHGPVFFGRDDESRAAIELIERGAPRLIMILGASGSGKSSLARAGIIPKVRRANDRWLIVDPFRPGREPFVELAESLARSYRRYAPEHAASLGDRERIRGILERAASTLGKPSAENEQSPEPEETGQAAGDKRVQRLIEELEGLRRDPPPQLENRTRDFLEWGLEDLRRICSEGTDTGGTGVVQATPFVEIALDLRQLSGRREARILLVVDQFEELLGRKESDNRAERFLTLLRAAIEAEKSPFLVIGTMRSDFLGLFQREAALRSIDFESLSLGPMRIEGMRRVIEQPARLGAITLENGLTDRLLADTETPDALPLLSFTLAVLWRGHHETGKLTVRDYEDLGGLQGAVAREADAILERAKRQDKEDELRRAFLQMARISEDGSYARKPIRWAKETIIRIRPIIDEFVGRHLLVSRMEGDEPIVEVAHEALFRSWTPLRTWLDAARSDLLLRQQLRRDAEDWQQSGRAKDNLWRGGRLLQARDTLGRKRLNSASEKLALEAKFVSAGLRRRRRLWLILASTAAIVVAFLAVFLWYALVQADRAKDQQTIAERAVRVSEARRLAASSARVRGEAPILGGLLAVEAMKATAEVGESTLDVWQALHEWLTEYSEDKSNPLRLYTGVFMIKLLFSENSRYLLAIDANLYIQRWYMENLGNEDLPSSQMLRSGNLFSDTHTDDYRIEHTNRWLLVARRYNHGESPGSGQDGALYELVELWDLRDERLDPTISIENRGSKSRELKISNDGKWLLAIREDDSIGLWRLNALTRAASALVLKEYKARTATFSEDSRWLVAGSDQRVYLWDLEAVEPMRPRVFDGPTGQVGVVAIGPHNRWLAAGSEWPANQVVAWQLGPKSEQVGTHVLPPVEDLWRFAGLGFSPDGRWLVVAHDDAIRFCDLETVNPLREATVMYQNDQHMSIRFAPVFSRNSRWFSTWLWGNKHGMWDLTSEDIRGSARIISGESITFSEDRRRFVLMDSGKARAQLYSLDDPNPFATWVDFNLLLPESRRLGELAISPDTRWLAMMDQYPGETIILHPLSSNLRPFAERLISRNFTNLEWERYFPGKAYRKTIERLPSSREEGR